MRAYVIGIALGFCASVSGSAAVDLVSRTLPADGDRATFRASITIHFDSPVELDSSGDGRFTTVRSSAVEAADPDISIAVNEPARRNHVRFERDDDNDPDTPGGIAVTATAEWELSDFPPLLRIVPAQPLERDAVYRVIVFAGADPARPSARRVSDRAPAEPHAFTFRTLPPGLRGTVQQVSFVPSSLGYPEDYDVYLPPAYDGAAEQRYPVLYLLHGAYGDYTAWTSASYTTVDGGRAAEIADRLIDGGTIEPLILVMPDGNGGPSPCDGMPWHHLFSNDWDGSYRYGDYASTDLPDDVEARFAAAGDRLSRGVAGFSMGGFGAASLGWGRASRFAFVAPLSAWEYSAAMTAPPDFPACDAGHSETIPDFGPCIGEMLQAVIGPPGGTDLTHMRTVNGRDLALTLRDSDFRGSIFIGHGVADLVATVSWSDDVSCALAEAGVAHCYKRPAEDGHTWSYWNQALEQDVLPRFNAQAYFAPLSPDIDADCVNSYVRPLADTDLDGIYDDGDRSGVAGDAPCASASTHCDDNCRDVPNADQIDTDHDGLGDACDPDQDNDEIPNAEDCAPLDPVHGRPPELTGLRLSGKDPTRLTWNAAPSADAFEVSRGPLSAFPIGDIGSHIVRGLVTPEYDDLEPPPPPGAVFTYLVRGVDTGCGGPGSWGHDLDRNRARSRGVPGAWRALPF